MRTSDFAGGWRATVHGVAKSDINEHLSTAHRELGLDSQCTSFQDSGSQLDRKT